MSHWEWLGLVPFVLAAALVGAGIAFGLGLKAEYGLVSGFAACILAAILHRIRGGDWPYLLLLLTAPALIGEVLGAGLAILSGFPVGIGLIDGCIILSVFMPLIMFLRPWHGEGIAWASQVVVLVPAAGVIGAVIAVVFGLNLSHAVIGCSSVPSILALLAWIAYFQNQSESTKASEQRKD